MLGSGYFQHDLIVVWTFWSTGSSANNLTASVTDNNNPNSNWVSAVGPTLQSASNTAAQIFYVANTTGSGTDPVTVSYKVNGTLTNASTSGCVFVEYQGADTVAPLDSVSEAISNSAGNLLDSGTVAPANANLLVFGGGTWDQGSLVAGSGFTSIQASGGSITEQNTTAITANNALQRATAVPNPMTPGSGNWIMQMAVFRAATWTVAGGSSSTRARNTIYADQLPGATPDAQLNSAIAGATPGQVIEYRCTPGATLPQFAATVSVSIPVDIKLGQCVFQGPAGNGTTNNPMFAIPAGISGEVIEGASQATTLESMCNKCDTIHFTAGTSSNPYTSENWIIQNLTFSDTFCVTSGTSCTTNRTGGTAIYMDALDQFHGALGFRISNVRMTGMYNQIHILYGENSTLQDIRGVIAVSTGIIVQGSTGISFLNVEEYYTQVASAATEVPTASGGSGALGTGSGVHVDSSPWTQFIGGQYPNNAGCGIFTSGTSGGGMNSLLIAGTEAEADGLYYQHDTTCLDGFRLQDTYGFSITGVLSELHANGSGFRIIGGFGSISGAFSLNNGKYGLDDSGTSSVTGKSTIALNVSGMDTPGPGSNVLGNFNDPVKVAMVLNGAHLNSGAPNGDLSGTCTLGTNCGITFTTPFANSPVCVATDTIAANSVRVVTTPTTATFTGTGTHVLNYVCVGNPN